MLHKLISTVDEPRSQTLVVSLGAATLYAEQFEALNAPVVNLDLRPNRPALLPIVRMRRHLRRFRPELLQGWMYHGNLVTLLGRPLVGLKPPIIWSIRATLGDDKFATTQVIRLGARLSHIPCRIVYNSNTSAEQHEAIGYDSRRSIVIPNGFDTTLYRPDPARRAAERARLGINDSTVVVGLVARYHPMKNHVGFLRAAATLIAEGLDVAFVVVGRDISLAHPVLGPVLRKLGVSDSPQMHLLPELPDVASLTNAFDIACSASTWGEAFPNVLGESMAAGVPCVATDVGDSAWIVGRSGIIVPPANEDALARAIRELVTATPDQRQALGRLGRDRVIRDFDIGDVGRRYAALFNEVVAESRATL